MRTILTPMAVGAALTASVLTGCSSASDTAAEKIAEATSGADIDIDENGEGNVRISTPDGVVSTGAELPDDFPDDVPVIDGTISAVSRSEIDTSTLSIVFTVTVDGGGKETFATMTSDIEAAGWTQVSKTEGDSGAGYGGLAGYEKGDDRELTINVGPGMDSSETSVMYIVTDRAAA